MRPSKRTTVGQWVRPGATAPIWWRTRSRSLSPDRRRTIVMFELASNLLLIIGVYIYCCECVGEILFVDKGSAAMCSKVRALTEARGMVIRRRFPVVSTK